MAAPHGLAIIDGPFALCVTAAHNAQI
jgi:hypothetical protein